MSIYGDATDAPSELSAPVAASGGGGVGVKPRGAAGAGGSVIEMFKANPAMVILVGCVQPAPDP
eukprot:SAG22_NODE_620_length_8513_cov_3.934870_4_plen_64_part_00